MEKELIKKTIEEIFKHLKCTLNECSFLEEEEMTWYTIETPDSRLLIGREGETLRSLNHIIRKIIDKNKEEPTKNLFVDINGYQKKRLDSLKNIAHMMEERSKYFKSNIELDPMPAYERRIIHMFLEGSKDVTTESQGVGKNRKVIIKYNKEEDNTI